MPRSLSEEEASVEEGVVRPSNRVPTMRTDCDTNGSSWDLSSQQGCRSSWVRFECQRPAHPTFSKFSNCIDENLNIDMSSFSAWKL